jgi:hypothetical protein
MSLESNSMELQDEIIIPIEKEHTNNFGIGKQEIEKWVDKTQGEASRKPSNFLRYARRQHLLIQSALLKDEYKPDNPVKDWLEYQHESSYWDKRHKELVEAKWNEKTVVDLGAGLGSLLEYSLKAGMLPKKMILVEPFYNKELNERVTKLCGNDVKVEITEDKVTYTVGDSTIEVYKAAVGKGNLPKLIGHEQVDVMLMAGVAPHMQWETTDEISFKDVLKELSDLAETTNASVAFSFSLDTDFDIKKLSTIPDYLKNKYEDIFKGWKNKGRYSPKQLAEFGFKPTKKIFYGNYIGSN